MEQDGELQGLAITGDGKKILTGGEDKKLRVWDVETHEPIGAWDDHEGHIPWIDISPDDCLVASCDDGGRIIIWDMAEGGMVTSRHSIETGSVADTVCFSPNGKQLVSGHDDYAIRIFDVESGDLILGPIAGHTGLIWSIIWSVDGTRIFSGSADASIRCWDSDTGEPIGEPWTGHTDYIFTISLSPDGAILGSASWDHTVRFWATNSGDPINVPLQHDSAVYTLTFPPSGGFVVCGESSGKLSLWRVPWWDDSQKKV
jgi:WD40 repeat protein